MITFKKRPVVIDVYIEKKKVGFIERNEDNMWVYYILNRRKTDHSKPFKYLDDLQRYLIDGD